MFLYVSYTLYGRGFFFLRLKSNISYLPRNISRLKKIHFIKPALDENVTLSITLCL